jgi:rod shape determining protein RodA
MQDSVTSITRKLFHIHFSIILVICMLAGTGFMMLYSAAGGNMDPWASAQLMRFLPAFIGMLVVAVMPVNFWLRYAYLFYAGALGLLVFVEISGHIGMGAQRWFAIGPITVQPSEIAKLAIILALARYFHRMPPLKYSGIIYLIPPALLLVVPAVFVLRQPNLGTTTIIVAVSIWIAFAAGVRWRYFLTAATLLLIALPFGWSILHDYQKQRVMTFLDPAADPLGSGYNIMQSMIAIGSGGLHGKGFLQGSQAQLDFLPEKQTDFIFTMLTEEFGFIGGMGVLIGYTILILYAMAVAIRARHMFGSLVAHGVAALLFLHMTINIAMVMGLIPVVGIPLPLLSYGGSILMTVMFAFGLLLNIWVHRDVKLATGSGTL